MEYTISFPIGHFINHNLWLEAIRLLEFQATQREKNKHFNTLSMFYYASILSNIEYIKDVSYFESRVANDLFYGMKKEFAVYNYLMPKLGLGLRSYKFFSYPLRVLYYSIGLYLVKLTQEYIDEYKPEYPQVKAYYGGKLRFEKEKLVINSQNLYYKKHYKEFRKTIADAALLDVKNTVVLHLDVKDYFDEISIAKLLNFIDRYIKPSTKTKFSFDTATIDAIIFFFKYINSDRLGIPQTENDIIGGFIGYLYLIFADHSIDYEVKRNIDEIKKYEIIRYVDDIYILITFKREVGQAQRETMVDSLSARVADALYYRLGLKLNTKSRLYWLRNDEDLEDLLRNLKKVSSQYYINDDNENQPQERLNSIFYQLLRLKRAKMGAYFVLESSKEDDILKEIYDTSVDQILYKPVNIAKLEKIFTKFNYDLVKSSPLEITIIMLHSKKIRSDYRKSLLGKVHIPTDDADLILKFLSYTGFDDAELLEKLKQNAYMKDIVSMVLSKDTDIEKHGYYNVSNNGLLLLFDRNYIIEQIRLRSMFEKNEYYSVAFNHLLNEIHSICFFLDKNTIKSPKEYDAADVRNFLISRNVPHDICAAIRNMFDRRNVNQVSHPGSPQNITWSVTKKEYNLYYESVDQCLQLLLP